MQIIQFDLVYLQLDNLDLFDLLHFVFHQFLMQSNHLPLLVLHLVPNCTVALLKHNPHNL